MVNHPASSSASRPLSLGRRLVLLARRAWRARAFGVRFKGTTSFRIPGTLRINGREQPFSTPPGEIGPDWDFINLFLDDDYGLRELADAPKTILDVGANCGLFSLHARHRFPNAKIHAYEPNPRVFQHAAANLGPANVTVFPAGVGSKSGRVSMEDAGESRMGRTVADGAGDIPIVPLAEAVSRLGTPVDLLKLDCEGAEWDIFQATDVLQNVRAIRMEYHLDATHRVEDLTRIAQGLGFRVDRLVASPEYGLAWLSRA